MKRKVTSAKRFIVLALCCLIVLLAYSKVSSMSSKEMGNISGWLRTLDSYLGKQLALPRLIGRSLLL